MGSEDAGASRSPPAVWPSIPPAPVASARNPLLDRRWDFPPLSLRPTLCRAGQAATGRDARGYLKLSTRYSCWSRPMSGTWRGREGTCGDPRLRAVKSPACAYPGSNPGPATSATTSADMVTIQARRCDPRARFRSDFAPADALRTRRVVMRRRGQRPRRGSQPSKRTLVQRARANHGDPPPAAGPALSGGCALAGGAAAQTRGMQGWRHVVLVEGADVGAGRDDLVDPVQ
jgi:hypothetical protein